jgi:hypothetical protein
MPKLSQRCVIYHDAPHLSLNMSVCQNINAILCIYVCMYEWCYTYTPTTPPWRGAQFKEESQGQLYLHTHTHTHTHTQSRDSSVGIALGYGMDDRGSSVRFPAGAGNFSLHHRLTQPPIQWVPWALSLGVKRLGHEADQSPLLVPKIKNELSCTSTSPLRLHGVVFS